ncbi:deoxyribodipyrimidine photo-lyase [Halorubrum sp. SY-15]|uniref:deoxyribodipyrimidine photo-lyase n=1 Tax=Halorubrum sp. SY-15 TaxID=3402277 RepID=UPI003EBF0C76
MQVYWHRRNLRPHPNPALSTALTAAKRDGGGVVPVFVLDDAILAHADGLGVAFMLGSLRTLRAWYEDHGSDLVIQHGDPTDVVHRIANAVAADRVVWNHDHSRLARGRDRAVKRALTRTDVAYRTVPNDDPPVRDAAELPADPAAHLVDTETLPVETQPVPRLTQLGDGAYDAAPLVAGTETARKRLRALANGTTYRRADDTRETGGGPTIDPRTVPLEWLPIRRYRSPPGG